MMTAVIQVAGVMDAQEARLLVEEGVFHIGFPLRLPVHKEDLSDEEAERIIRTLQPPASGFLITYLREAEDILKLSRRLGVRTVQLHGEVSPEETARLKFLAPELSIIKSLIIKRDNLPRLMGLLDAFSRHVDAFITDTFDPSTGACGATGMTHDWGISRSLVLHSPRPVILAGGLNPHNVYEAVLKVRPAGVDVHTGVEGLDGRKDRGLVRAFVRAARNAFRICSQGAGCD